MSVEVSESGQDGESGAQLTQGAEAELNLLTQHSSEGESSQALILMTPELEEQFQQSRSTLAYDGLVFEADGKQTPLAFFRNAEESFDVLVGRGPAADVVVPSKDGKCGVSRAAFRLLRNSAGAYSILSTNAVPFFVRSPQCSLRVVGLKPGDAPISVSLALDDRLCFNDCFLYFHVSAPTSASSVTDSLSAGLDSATDYLITEAERGLAFIRESADARVLDSVMPRIVANLSSLLPRDGVRRYAPYESPSQFNEDRSNYRFGPRRRFGGGGRGRGNRGRVRFR